MASTEDIARRSAIARERLFGPGGLPEGTIPPIIARSWRRCAEHGLSFDQPAHQDPLSRAALRQERDRHRELLLLASPELDTLHQAMLDRGGMVLLTDGDGLILDARGDPGFVSRARRVSLQPGAGWGETTEGTNAVGTALAERALVQVRGPEHYLKENAFLICTAMPVMNPFGGLAGVIDVSGDIRRAPANARPLVRLAVTHLEHCWVERIAGTDLMVRLHPHPAWLDTPHEGVMAFRDGVLQAANPAALAMLQLDRSALGRARLDELFEGGVESGLRRLRNRRDGRSLHARIERIAVPSPLRRVTAAGDAATAPPRTASRGDGTIWDPESARLLARTIKALDAGIPVLLQGETGTGKESFLRAAHAGSRRAGGPLVVVNCTAIPEALLESELFGDEEGGATAAQRGGSQGQIRRADGGILFLDEIGDMPAGLQARLLRVLQDGEVAPVGGRPAKVGFHIVAATRGDLAAAVEAGTFRADLYYRLKHLVVSLAPLRDRGPLDPVIDALLAACGAPASGIGIAAAARACLQDHDWPGNLRELANLLRTLVVLADDNSEIDVGDLPAELRRCAVDAAPTAGAADLKSLTDTVLRAALARRHGNFTAAARDLGVHRSTLYRRLKGGASA